MSLEPTLDPPALLADRFRLLVEGVTEYAIYMLDPRGTIVTWNAGAERVHQYKSAEIIGKNAACLCSAEDVAGQVPDHHRTEAGRLGHMRCQGTRIRKDGSAFQADVTLTAMRDSTGRLIGFSEIARDITDQVRDCDVEATRLAGEKAREAKSDFLAAISHELRTPLTPALAAASFLAHNASRFPAEFSDELDTIRRNVQLQARLIDDLLDLTHIKRGKIALHLERLDAHTLIRQAFEMSRSDAEKKQLQITMALGARQHRVCVDPIRMQQVFWNLLSNAVKFTPLRGCVEIRTSNDEQDFFLFEVIDDGIGIDPVQQQSLFQPFEQGDRSATRQFGGLGLGLATCKLILDLHNGQIDVRSNGRSHGSTFRVRLESVPEQNCPEPVRSPSHAKRALRILLVEDHNDTRTALARLLTYFGHHILVADCTEAALAIVKSKEFDVVLSDIGLPDGTGYDVIEQAKRVRPVMGVALTGLGSDEDRQRGREAGFDFHLTKPVDFHELRTVLDQACVQ